MMKNTRILDHRCRGSAMVFVILLSVVLTGLVITIAWTGGMQAQWAGGSIHLDQATMAAESASQVAVWQFKHNNGWRQPSAPSTLPTLTIGSSAFTNATVCTDAGAVATLYWPFSEGTGATTADASGHANTGNLIGGVSWTTGHYGQGLLFDGSTGYVDAGNGQSTNISGSVTLAAWININAAAADQKIGGNQDNIAGGYKMTIFGQVLEMECHNASNTWQCNRYVSGGTVLSTGTWYHVTGIVDGNAGTISTYVDGVLDRQLTGIPSNALASTQGHLIMGKEPWVVGPSTRYFNGIMDEVRIYNRALSAQEVKTLANSSVHMHVVATQNNSASATVDFVCSSPLPLPPVAPALTVGGLLAMKNNTVTGDVQCASGITINSPTTVSGHVVYGTTFSDPGNNLTLTYQGNTATPTQQANSLPTINYANIQSLAVATYAGGSNQNFSFGLVDNGINVIVVTGNCTNPTIDTSVEGGVLLITGNLVVNSSSTWGTAGRPAYVIVKGHATFSSTVNLSGALYIAGKWTHANVAISGDVCVGGAVIDNSVSGSSFVAGSIPWFDPRISGASTPQNLFYVDYQGAHP